MIFSGFARIALSREYCIRNLVLIEIKDFSAPSNLLPSPAARIIASLIF